MRRKASEIFMLEKIIEDVGPPTFNSMKCKAHPRYKGLRRPRVACESCWRLYIIQAYCRGAINGCFCDACDGARAQMSMHDLENKFTSDIVIKARRRNSIVRSE